MATSTKKGASTAPLSRVSGSSLLRLNSFGIGEEDAARVDDVAVKVGLRTEGAGLRDAVSPIGLDHVVFSAGRTPGDAGREVERLAPTVVGRDQLDVRWCQVARQIAVCHRAGKCVGGSGGVLVHLGGA